MSDAQWQRAWEINFLSHVYAARAVIPRMLEQGSGYLLQTASAAGLLTQIGAAPYSVTKHAAVAFAEWLSITYHRQGLRVSCLCSQGVHTRMLDDSASAIGGLVASFCIDTRASGGRRRPRTCGRTVLDLAASRSRRLFPE